MSSLPTFVFRLSVLGLLVAGSCHFVASVLFGYNNENLAYKYRYGELFERRVDAHVALLGSSEVAHGIVPSLIQLDGATVYNFAFNGAGPSFTLDWYERLFSKHYAKPKLVVYGVGWQAIMSSATSRKVSNDYAFFPARAAFNLFAESRDLDLLWSSTGATQWNRFYGRWNPTVNSHYLISLFSNGFLPYENEFGGVVSIDQHAQADDAEIASLTRLVRRMSSDTIQVVLVGPPVYLKGVDMAIIGRTRRLFQGIADQNAIALLDFNGEFVSDLNYDSSMFSDGSHLSSKGAVVFSNLLNKQLQRLIQQHRITM